MRTGREGCEGEGEGAERGLHTAVGGARWEGAGVGKRPAGIDLHGASRLGGSGRVEGK